VGNKLRRRPGSLDLGLPFADWLNLATQPTLVRVLPVDAEIARLANNLPGDFHEDPADRFIVATAIHHRLVLLTSDEKVLAYSHVRSFDTR
jgi:PIN domain nuclease of toxin-antitoxin system